jgi:hypothetical protein
MTPALSVGVASCALADGCNRIAKHVEMIMLNTSVIPLCFMASPFLIYQFDAAQRLS